MAGVNFGTQDWVDELVTKANSSDAYKKAGKNWEGDLKIIILAEEGLTDKDIIYYLDPHHGEIRSASLLETVDEKETAFTLTGPYSVWKEITSGKTDSMKAIMKGQLKVKGSMAKLMRQVKASQVMMKIMTSIETIYSDE
ncbi:MAG: hypothetical protein HF978_13460 [Desulfobacteraceae bacterium]|nr:SCP2 sterol-binding domain-containing protein [Desulfobacteraceae bacterium]MBC2756550.1 hypothetical protein [Desulfobacteraceae bacterium]